MPEIYVIMATPLKCVAMAFKMSPEGNTGIQTVNPNEWLELLPPVPGVKGLNPADSGVITRKGYIGGWIFPEYFVAWLIPIVGFDC